MRIATNSFYQRCLVPLLVMWTFLPTAKISRPTLLHADEVLFWDRQQQLQTARGEVAGWTADYLTIRSGTSATQIPTSDVEKITAEWTDPHRQADIDFQHSRYDQAVDSYTAALQSERRPWVQQRIRAQIVWCHQNSGRWIDACRTFNELLGDEADSPHFDCIPLCWTGDQPSTTFAPLVDQFSASNQPDWRRLIAASWRLTTDQPGSIRLLRQLAAAEQTSVKTLARFQLWRSQRFTATPRDAERWLADVETVPWTLRAGGYWIAGEAFGRVDRRDDAILSLLRVPMHFDQNRGLAQAALLQAGDLLSAEEPVQAAALFRRAIQRGPETNTGQLARQKLSQLELGDRTNNGSATRAENPQP